MSGPKKFVEVLTSDDDNDVDHNLDSDGEVQFIPYEKPPPPVIDLLVSSEDEAAPNKSESKKNRKRKRSKTYQTDESTDKLCSDSIQPSSAAPNSDSSPTNETPLSPDRSPSAVNDGQNERMLIHAVTTTRAVNDADREPDASVNAEPIVASHNQSLSNVSANGSLSENDDSVHQRNFLNSENASLPSIRIASSIFAPINEVLGEPLPFSSARNGAVVVEPVIQNDAMSGTTRNAAELGRDTTCPVLGIRSSGLNQDLSGGQRVLPEVGSGGGQIRKKVAPTKRKRNTNPPPTPLSAAGDIPVAGAPAARKRVSKQQRAHSAKQRTNEEINNFLTTLGIYEPSETISPPKRTRRSRQGDTLTIIPPLTIDVQALSLVPPPPVLEPDIVPSSVVPSNTAAVPPPKEIRRSKVTTPASEARKLNQPKPVDATVTATSSVAALTSTITQDVVAAPVPAFPDILLSQTRFPLPPMSADVGILTRTERAALSFNISSVLDPPPPPPTISKHPIPHKPSSSQSSERRPRSIDQQTSKPKSTETSSVVQQPYPYTYTIDDNDNEHDVFRPSYIPSKWTSGMVKFYDCTAKEDFRLSRVLAEMSDNPALWETNEHQFSNQKMNKRMRCVNCNQFGHVVWNCKEKRKKRICHLCGEEGHGGSGRDRDRGNNRCPRAVCLNCGRRQPKVTTHGCRHCLYTRKPPICGTCSTEGHSTSHCPDNWRRYFSTTTLGQDETMQIYGDKPVYQLRKDSYCSTCAQKGHTFFHCRYKGRTSSGDKYTKQNPLILDELPQLRKRIPATATSTVVSSNSKSTEEESLQPQPRTRTMDCDYAEQRSTSNIVTSPIISTATDDSNDDDIEVLPIGNSNKCMDPECDNTPKPNTFCFEMFIKPNEHKLMRKAQEENKISDSMKPTDQISILQSRNAIHIYTDDIVQGQVDAFKLISKLNIEACNNKSKAKVPEVITLEDDDTEVTKTAEKLTVALLESEWDLIFSESLKVDGLISQLTEKFKVNVYISKDNLMVTIENGTEENKKLAQKNIVFWLECQAANVEYVMQLRVENLTDNTSSLAWTKKKKKKQKSPHPKSRSFKKRKRLENNSAMTSDLMPNSSQNHNNNNNSQESAPGKRASRKLRRKMLRQQNRKDRGGQVRTNEIPMSMTPPSASYNNNNNNMRYFNNSPQASFPNGFEGRVANPHYSGGPPPDFHPSFINHQQHQQGHPPPLMDFIAFRYDTPRRSRGSGSSGGSVRGRNNRGNSNYTNNNNNRSRSPNKRQQDGNRNLLRYYNTGTD